MLSLGRTLSVLSILAMFVSLSIAPARGATTKPVAFQLIGNHIYVPIEVNGTKTFRFVFDSGAAASLTPQAAQALHVRLRATFQVHGTGDGAQTARVIRLNSMRIGEAHLERVEAAVFDFPASIAEIGPGAPFGGLVGREFLAKYVTTIDYVANALTLEPASIVSAAGREGAIPCKIREEMPAIDGNLDGHPGTYVIDTGNQMSIAMLGPAIERDGLREKYRPHTHAILGRGIGGYVRGDAARAGTFVVAGRTVHDPIVALPSQKAGFFTQRGIDGNLGTGLLRNFTLTIDEPHRIVVFVPNAHFDERGTFDRAGFSAERSGDAFSIIEVTPQSPASERGLTPGDRILAVDGKPAREIAAARFGELFARAAGTVVWVTLERDRLSADVAVTLRDLI